MDIHQNQSKTPPTPSLSTSSSTSSASPFSFLSTVTAQTYTFQTPSTTSSSLISDDSQSSSSHSPDLNLSRRFDINRTIRPNQATTAQNPPQHQSRRNLIINRPKGYYQSPYGSEVEGTHQIAFTNAYKNHSLTKKNYQVALSKDPLSSSQIAAIPAPTTPTTTTTGSQFLSQHGNAPLSISDVDPRQLKGKKVILRTSDTPEPSLPTIQYLLEAGSTVILSPSQSKKNPHGLKDFATKLSSLINTEVTLVSTPQESTQSPLQNVISDQNSRLIVVPDVEMETGAATFDIAKPDLYINDHFVLSTWSPKKSLQLDTPSVVGMMVAKEIDDVKTLYDAIQDRGKESAIEHSQPHPIPITKTLIMGAPTLESLAPALRTSFSTTNNFIFGNEASYSLANAAHLTTKSLQKNSSQMFAIQPSNKAFAGSPQDTAAAIVFMSNSAKAGKSVWIPHDYVAHNPANDTGPVLSFSTSKFYTDKGTSSLTITDIGASTRKDYAWAVDNIIAEQLEGRNQLIYWFGSMKPSENGQNGQNSSENDQNGSNPTNDGNATIIESLHKATTAGVLTVVGGDEVVKALEQYKSSQQRTPQQSQQQQQTSGKKAPIPEPTFSLISSSPQVVSALISGAAVFGDFPQEQH
jgi:hypothetical protein